MVNSGESTKETIDRLDILLIEDNPADARLTRELLAESGALSFDLVHVSRLEDGIAQLAHRNFAVILLDLTLPDASGLETVIRLRQAHFAAPLIVLSGLADEASAIAALKSGAQEYLVKGQGDGHLISRAIRYAIERRRVEAQLIEAKEAAEAASRAKSEFLANMSHELRTPLNAIIGFAEILQMQTMGALGHPSYAGYVRDIHTSGVHLLNIINDILDLSKIEIGHRELRAVPVDIAVVVAASVRFFTERAANSGVELVVDMPTTLPQLLADEQMVKQILLNLLSNAIKFTPQGGRISVSAGIERDGRIFLSVSDTGIGIAPADIARAFEPFVQIDSALNRKYPGTGLGLPLVKSMIELHGGALSVTSREQAGTTMTLHFPAQRTLEAAASETGSQKVPG